MTREQIIQRAKERLAKGNRTAESLGYEFSFMNDGRFRIDIHFYGIVSVDGVEDGIQARNVDNLCSVMRRHTENV